MTKNWHFLCISLLRCVTLQFLCSNPMSTCYGIVFTRYWWKTNQNYANLTQSVIFWQIVRLIENLRALSFLQLLIWSTRTYFQSQIRTFYQSKSEFTLYPFTWKKDRKALFSRFCRKAFNSKGNFCILELPINIGIFERKNDKISLWKWYLLDKIKSWIT